MNDNEKSVLLAKAMGWFVSNMAIQPLNPDTWYKQIIVDTMGLDVGLVPLGGSNERRKLPMKLDLYLPANMVLAMRAFKWGVESDEGFRFWISGKGVALGVMIQENGIRRALDYLVQPLAVEAGLIEVDDEVHA